MLYRRGYSSIRTGKEFMTLYSFEVYSLLIWGYGIIFLTNMLWRRCTMKKIISALLLIIIIMTPAVVKADTKSYDISRLLVNAVIEENGDVYVEEELSYSFKGDFNGVYRNLLKKGSEGYSISEVLIRDKNDTLIPIEQSNSSNDNTYQINDTGSQCSIKIFSKSSNESKTFIIRYTIHGAAVKTDTSGELYWSFYTVENGINVKDFELNLSLKNAEFDPNVTKHWAYVDGSDLKDSYDTRGIHISGKDLTGVLGVRVLFQPDYLKISSVNRENTETVPRQSDNYNSNRNTYTLPNKTSDFSAGVILIPLGIIASAFIIYKWSKANQRYREAVEAYRAQAVHFSGSMLNTPPSNLPPALVEFLVSEKSISPASISATLYYLSSKGYYTLEKSNYEKTRLFGSEEMEDLIFKRNYGMVMPEYQHLKYFIDWMAAYEEEGMFSLRHIEENVGTSRGAMDFRNRFSDWEDIIGHEATELGFYTTIENRQILSNKYYDEQLKWLAYKKYLQEYTEKNQGHEPLSNIDEALIYASVLGIGTGGLEDLFERVRSQNEEVYHLHNYTNDYMGFFIMNYYLWDGINDSIYHHDSGIDNSSFTGGDGNGFGGFSDGGGFSGGGGGDSGAF